MQTRFAGMIQDVVAERPVAADSRPYRFPSFVRRWLPNGVEVIVAPVPRLPLVSVRLLVDAGAGSEDRRIAGVAALTTKLLAEGTQRLDGAALAEEFERLGGSLSVSASWDDASIATTVLRDRFEPVLRLLAEVLLTPAFPEREVFRIRDERLSELLEVRAEPRGLADQMLEAFVYGGGSRFALPEAGSRETVESLTREHVRAFYESRFTPGALTVIVVGDIAPEEALSEVASIYGDALGAYVPAPEPDASPASRQRTIHLVCRPDAPQTELRVGHVGIPRRHVDYFNVVVMNAMLGGVFNSRINLNLRERHAYTYGASSYFYWRRAAGPFGVSTAVATTATAPAVTEIVRELERMRDSLPAADELSLSVSYLDGVFPIRFETTEAIGSAMANLKIFDLSDDYYDSYRARIRAVSSHDVQRAAQTHLRPDQLQIVAVGDPRVGLELEALELGSVLYWNADGLPTEKP